MFTNESRAPLRQHPAAKCCVTRSTAAFTKQPGLIHRSQVNWHSKIIEFKRKEKLNAIQCYFHLTLLPCLSFDHQKLIIFVYCFRLRFSALPRRYRCFLCGLWTGGIVKKHSRHARRWIAERVVLYLAIYILYTVVSILVYMYCRDRECSFREIMYLGKACFFIIPWRDVEREVTWVEVYVIGSLTH